MKDSKDGKGYGGKMDSRPPVESKREVKNVFSPRSVGEKSSIPRDR